MRHRRRGFNRLGAHTPPAATCQWIGAISQLSVAQQMPSDVEVASYYLVPESSNAGIIKKGEPDPICANRRALSHNDSIPCPAMPDNTLLSIDAI